MSQELITLPNPAGTLTTHEQHDAERVSVYRTASKSKKTLADYQSHWRSFISFCDGRNLNALPATSHTVERFITHLADEGHSISTIRARLAAIGYIHEIASHDNPTKTIGIRETMKGISREKGTAPTKKSALTIDELRKAVSTLAEDLRGQRDRAMLLVGYFGAFRRSELVALTVNQIRFQREQTRVLIAKSKTDQDAKGKYKHLPVLTDDLADICPSRALKTWLDTAGISTGAVFRAIDQWEHIRDTALTGKEVARLVKRSAEAIGLSAKDFAGHSLRSGFVTDATQAGANDAEIMEQTGHTSRETVDEYRQLAGRGALEAIRKITGLVLPG